MSAINVIEAVGTLVHRKFCYVSHMESTKQYFIIFSIYYISFLPFDVITQIVILYFLNSTIRAWKI